MLREVLERQVTGSSARFSLVDSALYFRGQLALGVSPASNPELTMAACQDGCPEPCMYDSIVATISSSILVSPSSMDVSVATFNKMMLGKNASPIYSAENLRRLTLLELNYESRQIKVVERVQRLSIEELISNIGGCVGVWSGLSILSIVQIFVYVGRGAFYHVCRKRNRTVSDISFHPEKKPEHNVTK